MEVRSAILYATIIIVLVFLPLFALPGMEGACSCRSGIAFIVSTLASLVVSVTVTPVLSFYLLPRLAVARPRDTRLLAWLKLAYARRCGPCSTGRAWRWRPGARGPAGCGGGAVSTFPAAVHSRAPCWSACA